MPIAPLVMPGAEPYLFPAGQTGCLIVHGFNSSTRENRDLGRYLADQGITTLGVRLPGHATTPDDLRRVRWTDWLAAVEDGLSMLRGSCTDVFIAGQSLGGVLTLTAAERYPFRGVIGISTPVSLVGGWQARLARPGLIKAVSPVVRRIPKPPLSHDADHPDQPAARVDIDPYPRYTTRALAEVLTLVGVMQEGLPRINAPLLLIQGRNDAVVAPDAMQQICARVSSTQTETLWLERSGHGVTMSEERDVAFRAIAAFIGRVSAQR